jgi:raffinose/stachyose/melibiose transport system substrate-binding protein
MKSKVLFLICVFLVFVTVAGISGGKTEDVAKITWSFWYQEPVELIETFNARHPEILLEYEQVDDDQYINILNTRLAAGEGPDIFATLNWSVYLDLVEQGGLVDLTNESWMSNYDDFIVDLLTAPNDHVYGICMGPYILNLFYNKELFAKYGLEVSMAWEDFLEVSEVLKQNGVPAVVQGNKDLWQNQFIVNPEEAMMLKDIDWVDKMIAGRAKYTDPEAVEVFKRYQTFCERGYQYEGSIGLTFPEAWRFFCEGKAAIMGGGSFFAAQVWSDAEPQFDWGCMALQSNLRGQPNLTPYGGRANMLVINNEGPHVKEALTFFTWVSSTKENIKLMAKSFGEFSAGKGVVADWAPQYQVIGEFMDSVGKMPHREAPAEIMNLRLKGLQEISIGMKTAEEVCADIQKALDESRK